MVLNIIYITVTEFVYNRYITLWLSSDMAWFKPKLKKKFVALDQEKTHNEEYKNYWLDICYHVLYEQFMYWISLFYFKSFIFIKQP